MLEEVILATRNKGKTKEFRSLFNKEIKNLFSLCELPSVPDIIEDGKTYSENALKKARTVCKLANKIALADDSGLEVNALGLRPGIFSSRYAGAGANDKDNIRKLLSELDGNPDRRARFVCSLVLVFPDGREVIAEGTCEGIILKEARGKRGFGYDPVFFLPERDKTMAELTAEEKNQISHRARAAKALLSKLN